MVGENIAFLVDRLMQQNRLALFLPDVRAGAVAEVRINVLALHHLQGVPGTQVMTYPAAADLFDFSEAQRIGVNFDPAGSAPDRSKEVVVQEQALGTRAQQAGVHAGWPM